MGRCLSSLLIFLFCSSTWADFDTRLTLNFRDYPIGGTLEWESGYNLLLYGSPGPTNPFYGYIRPGMMLGGQGEAQGFIDIYPLSILGVRFGSSMTFRYYEIDPFDCEVVVCDGLVQRNFYRVRANLGYAFLYALPFFYEGLNMATNFEQEDQNTPFALENGPLLASPGEDREFALGVTVGLKLSDSLHAIWFYKKAETVLAESEYQFWASGLRYFWGEWNVAVLGGNFQSNFDESSPSIAAYLSWLPQPSLDIKDQ